MLKSCLGFFIGQSKACMVRPVGFFIGKNMSINLNAIAAGGATSIAVISGANPLVISGAFAGAIAFVTFAKHLSKLQKFTMFLFSLFFGLVSCKISGPLLIYFLPKVVERTPEVIVAAEAIGAGLVSALIVHVLRAVYKRDPIDLIDRRGGDQ